MPGAPVQGWAPGGGMPVIPLGGPVWLPPGTQASQWTPPPPFQPAAPIFQDTREEAAVVFAAPPFVSSASIARIVQVLLGIAGLLALANAIYFIYGIDLQGRIITGRVLLPEVNGYNNLLAAMFWLRIGLLIVCGIAFMRWMWRSIRNSTILGAGYGNDTPRAAVIAWIIPFYCLVRPYQNMVDLHNRLLAPLQSRSGGWLMRSWWAFWLLGSVVGELVFISLRSSTQAGTGASRLPVLAWEAISAGLVFADAILAIVVVRQIQRLSDARLVARNGDPNRAIELVVASQRKRVIRAPFALATAAMVAIAIPTGLVYAGASAPPSWPQFQPPDGSFTVSMPAQPLEKRIPQYVSGGITLSGDAFRSAANENLVFVITYYDYPTGLLATIDPSTMYLNVDEAIGSEYTIDSKKDLTISGKAAHEIQAHGPDMWIVARYVISGDRLFVIEADFTAAQAKSPDIYRFLDSFALR